MKDIENTNQNLVKEQKNNKELYRIFLLCFLLISFSI